jgi:MoaA/NifB/PqqE/SkfB family radical SAM enzyme
MQTTKRVKIPTGPRCNIRCRFCYYWDALGAENPSTGHIKSLLGYAIKHGIIDIDFSGGEPTMRKDFPELVAYAKELGFRQICVITNGLIMARKKYIKRLVESGLNEVLFSLHGHDAGMHDYLTQIPGSFEKIIKAIQNAKELGIRIRTNSVMTRPNYKYLPRLAKLLLRIHPNAVNFISFNDWCSAYKKVSEMSCKYSELAPCVKKAIDILNPKIEKVTVRYVPFCFMQGYEKYVCNLLQKKYDPDEWVEGVKDRLVSGAVRHWFHIIRGLIVNRPFNRIHGFNNLFDEIILEQMREGYVKDKGCKKCKYYNICDGLEKSYARVIGLDEISPVPGRQISDPMYFRGDYLDNSS